MTRKWLNSYVEELTLQPLGSLRLDCPVCQKKNTFSVRDTGYERMYNCFYANCDARGRTGKRLTTSNAKSVIQPLKPTLQPKPKDVPFEIPDTFVPLTRNQKALDYVRSVNSYQAYLDNRAEIMYDIRQDRVVFLVKENKKIVDAVGKSLTNRKPKWYRYGKSNSGFHIDNDDDIIFVVEDCPSACSICSFVSAIALLGTNLLQSHINVLKQYKKVVVALDKDATIKAVELSRKISQYVNCTVAFLTEDLKNLKDEERERIIRKYID